MPVYCFSCPKCGHLEEVFRSIDSRNDPVSCPRCSDVRMARDHTAEAPGRPQTEWTDPIYSEAAGVHPDQIAECRQRFPHHEFDAGGRMIFRSRSHQKRCLQDIGMIDRDGFT